MAAIVNFGVRNLRTRGRMRNMLQQSNSEAALKHAYITVTDVQPFDLSVLLMYDTYPVLCCCMSRR